MPDKTDPSVNHMGGPSFTPDLKLGQNKQPVPPVPGKKTKADTQILKDEDIPPL